MMREVFGDGTDDDKDNAATRRRRRALERIQGRREKGCMDNLIDGSLMGIVLALCLCMVLGASFFAYKNLYYAVMKKFNPER